jgi:hypothetical protein
MWSSGIRNTEKLRFRPGTQEVWGVDHGSDNFGDKLGENTGRDFFTDTQHLAITEQFLVVVLELLRIGRLHGEEGIRHKTAQGEGDAEPLGGLTGPPLVDVPNVVGQPQATAQAQIVAAGFVVGGLMAATALAAAPAAWFGFDTAQSATTFWAHQLGAAAAIALGGGLLYALVFMAAESLARRAFPHQPQLWRVWSREGGATRATCVTFRTFKTCNAKHVLGPRSFVRRQKSKP